MKSKFNWVWIPVFNDWNCREHRCFFFLFFLNKTPMAPQSDDIASDAIHLVTTTHQSLANHRGYGVGWMAIHHRLRCPVGTVAGWHLSPHGVGGVPQVYQHPGQKILFVFFCSDPDDIMCCLLRAWRPNPIHTQELRISMNATIYDDSGMKLLRQAAHTFPSIKTLFVHTKHCLPFEDIFSQR